MTTEQLENIVHRKPFQPYRLILDDGEEVQVLRPRKSHVSGRVVSLAFQYRPKGSKTLEERLRMIPVTRVVAAEYIAA